MVKLSLALLQRLFKTSFLPMRVLFPLTLSTKVREKSFSVRWGVRVPDA
jgi:hypothetical protein